jgi:predicted nucleic acid-binding protein
MAYLLDADWVIQAQVGRQHAVSTLSRLAGQRIAISIVTVGEIYEGAFRSSNPQAELEEYRRFLSRFLVLSLTDAVMEQFAEMRAFLRRRGQLIADFDLIAAITALHHNLTLLTYNRRHFERIPDLRLYPIHEP